MKKDLKEYIQLIESISRTKTVYHGDDYDTTFLNASLMNNGNNQEGVGIYFSDSIETAKYYGKNIVAVDIDTSKFIDSRKEIGDFVSVSKMEQILKKFYKSDKETFYYFVSDWIEVGEPSDVRVYHIREMAENVMNEKVRDFQTKMAGDYGVELFVQTWNEYLPNIHGTYQIHNDNEIWYAIINTDLELYKV